MSFIGGYQSDLIGNSSPSDATEVIKGIAQIASHAETLAGENDTKIISPAKLAAYVANKVTGLWTDKGLIDCSANPNFPPGVAGHAYTVSVAGKVGGTDGQRVGIRDVIYCNLTNPGGADAVAGGSWTILQANLEAATELIAGYVRIASPNEVNLGIDDTKAITPLKLKTLLNTLLCFQNGNALGSIVPLAGIGNRAEGIYSTVLGGQNNRAIAAYSTAEGAYAEAALYNERAKAGGAFFHVKGSSQFSILNLMATIPPGATGVILTADGEASGANRWFLPLNSIQQFSIQLTITQNSGTDGSPGLTQTAIYEGTARNQAGSVNWVGGAPTVREVRQDAGFSPSIGFNFFESELSVHVDGLLERTLHASATVFITQTRFSLE